LSHSHFRAVIIAIAFVLAAIVFLRLSAASSPAPLPFFQRFMVAFFLPAAALGISALIRRVSEAEPLRENYARFRGTFELLLDLTVFLIVGIQLTLQVWIVLFHRFGHAPRMWFVPTTLAGLALVIAGNVLPRLRPNSTMGIRTPWTLGDERTWNRVHRAGGYLLAAFGLAILAVTYIDFQKVWWVALPGLVLTLAGLPLYSYTIWKSGRR
jgi:hypothetical protein